LRRRRRRPRRAAGWHGTGPVVAIVARTVLDALATSHLRHECRQWVQDCLVSVHSDSVIVVLGGESADEQADAATRRARLATAADRIAADLDGAVVIGPVVDGVAQAGRSLRSALAGLHALPGWAEAPNPVRADDLLPERLLDGDPLAGEQIQTLVTQPLRDMGPLYEETVATYLALGRSLEMTARTLFVHANTVRYRLGRVSKQIGWDATDARDGLVLHLAVIVGSSPPAARAEPLRLGPAPPVHHEPSITTQENAMSNAPTDVLTAVAEIVAEEADVDTTLVTPETRFADDLDIDSLGLLTIATQVEERFGVTLDDALIPTVKTVGALVDLVSAQKR
ncbi:helix-turn-helix domain-containing protein, partial [Actinomyces ruminis]